MEGTGKLNSFDKSIYEGMFRSDNREGFGKYNFNPMVLFIKVCLKMGVLMVLEYRYIKTVLFTKECSRNLIDTVRENLFIKMVPFIKERSKIIKRMV